MRYALGESLSLPFVAALQQLSPRQRAALLLHDVCGFSGRDAAVMLGTSVPSVASMVERARAVLDQRLLALAPRRDDDGVPPMPRRPCRPPSMRGGTPMAPEPIRAETRLPAQDLDRARRWYAEKLGLEPSEERPGGLRYETPAGVFSLSPRTGGDAHPTQAAPGVSPIQ